MAIHPTNPHQTANLEHTSGNSPTVRSTQENPPAPRLSSTKEQGGDPIHLSEEQEVYEAILQAIRQTPDIRYDKVQEIQRALESGQYHISADSIADRLIHDTIEHRSQNNE